MNSFKEGLFPKKSFRDERLEDIKNELEILQSNKEEIIKSMNSLIYEATILENIDKLDKVLKGELSIKPPEDKEQKE
jgi:hypothetical protein